MIRQCGNAFTSLHVPDACSAVPGTTDHLLRDGLADGVNSRFVSLKDHDWIAHQVNLEYLPILPASEESVTAD